MPLIRGRDEKGCWIKWGMSGKKYYYKCGNAISREKAKEKALTQARAIRASGYK